MDKLKKEIVLLRTKQGLGWPKIVDKLFENEAFESISGSDIIDYIRQAQTIEEKMYQQWLKP